MIITWDFTSADFARSAIATKLNLHPPSPYKLWTEIKRQLQALGILSERDSLYLHTISVPGNRIRIVVLLGIYLIDDLTVHGGLSYEMRELGRLEYPTCRILSDYIDGRLSQLELPFITSATVSVALVNYLIRQGCVRVRVKGGAYYVPDFAMTNVNEILCLLEDAGVRVRRISVERGSHILFEIAQDAITGFRQAMAELIRKIQETKQDRVRERALSDLQRLREFYNYYLTLFQELGGELEQKHIETEVSIEALAGLCG